MHTVSFWRGSAVAIIFFLSVSVPIFSFAAVGIDPQIPFSGTLKDADGDVLTGTYDMGFRIYTVATDGSALWTETFSNVIVTDGAFSVMLGSTTPLTIVDFNQALYLGVKIGGDLEMTPRERLGAAAYAFNANLLDGLDSVSFLRANQLITDLLVTNATTTNLKINALVDSTNSLGLNGNVLQTVNNLAQWVATSTLGLGTVTSVDMTVPTGLNISGNPITTSGTLALSYAAGYEGLRTASSTNWDSFYDAPSSRITNGDGLSWNGNTLDCFIANGTTLGCLDAIDWVRFNDKISSTSIDVSDEIAALVGDETGTGALVFSNDPLFSGFRSNASSTIGDGTGEGGLTVFGGATTTGNMYVGGNMTLSSETNESSLLTLTQTGTGNLMSLFNDSNELFSVFSNGSVGVGNPNFETHLDSLFAVEGQVSAQSFYSTLDVVNILSGSFEVLGGDASYIDAGIVLGNGGGISFGDDQGLTISMDTGTSGFNDLVIAPYPGGEAALYNYVNITTPGALWLTPNNVTNCTEVFGPECAPAFVLNEVGGASLYNLTFGDEADRYFEVNFTNGMKIPTGTIQIASLAGGVPLETDLDGNIVAGASDSRLKENIQTLDGALDTLLKLRGVRYEWRDKERFGTQTEVGFVAQELQLELPEVVRETNEYFSVKTGNIVAVVVEAVKELNTKVEEYFTRTERLEREVTDLRREIDALKGVPSSTGNSEEVSAPALAPEEVVSPAPVEEVVVDPAPEPEVIPDPVPEPEIPYVAE